MNKSEPISRPCLYKSAHNARFLQAGRAVAAMAAFAKILAARIAGGEFR